MKTIISANLKQTVSRRSGWTRLVTVGAVVIPSALVGLVAGNMLGGKPAPEEAPLPDKTTASAPPPVRVAGSALPPASSVRPAAAQVELTTPPAVPRPKAVSTKKARLVKVSSVPSPRSHMNVVRYGKSEQGRPLTAYVLGEGANVTMIFGAFHGNEPITDDIVLKLRDYLKANPEHLRGRRVILVPVVNPDGLRRGKRSNANGVDINRNFPGTWRKQATKARYNPGPHAKSESETRAVIMLMDTYRPRKVVSIHQPFHTMNYTGEPGRRLALAMKKYNRYPIVGDIGYPTPGSFGDYCGKTRRIAIVTYELPVQSAGAAWRANKDALLAAIAH